MISFAANPGDGERQQRGDQAEDNPQDDDRAARVPDDSQDNGYVAEGRNRSRQLLKKVRRSGIG